MTLAEKLALIKENRHTGLLLFKEGIFRHCYNEHAMHFTHNIKKMKVHTKYYKNIAAYMHYIGFPETSLQKYKDYMLQHLGAHIEKDTPSLLYLTHIQWKNKENYAVWKIPLMAEENRKQNAQKEAEQVLPSTEFGFSDTPQEAEDIYRKIKNYALEKASPIEAFNFLQKLKKKIDEREQNAIPKTL